jgi:hypothetical protein
MNDLLWSFMHIAIYTKSAGLTAAKRLRRVLGMLSSFEVKVLRPT